MLAYPEQKDNKDDSFSSKHNGYSEGNYKKKVKFILLREIP